MKAVEEIEEWWPSFEAQASSLDLRASINASPGTNAIIDKARSAYWKSFLLLEDTSLPQWPDKLDKIRQAFHDLRSRFLTPLEHPNEGDSLVDPLSDTVDSPWNSLRKDEFIRQEINQDVERCLPENLYFRQPSVQTMLLDILFVWTKLNPDIGYRQGMHELLAPIVWTVEKDSVDPQSASTDASKGIHSIFDGRYVSHDSFAIFTKIMQQVKSSYEIRESLRPLSPERGKRTTSSQDAAITERSKEIFDHLLAKVDPLLLGHLEEIGIIPQIFLIRWIRLLFGREFAFESVLQIWDKLFAEGVTPFCVDLVCVVMLLRIRWQLLDADNNEALKLLLDYPDLPPEHGPPTLVDDAQFLKTHLNIEGGQQMILARTGRDVPLVDIPLTQNDSKLLGNSSPRSKPRVNIEALLNDAARNIANQGKKWGVNQAVRDLSGELRKNVSSLQARTHSRMLSRDSSGIRDQQKSTSDLVTRIDELDSRNRSLARILEGAVAELWQQQEETSNEKPVDDKQMEAFTAAIAKVQFVQIYLEDSSLGLPPEDRDQTNSNANAENSLGSLSPKLPAASADQSVPVSTAPTKSKSRRPPYKPKSSSPEGENTQASEGVSSVPAKSERPPLEESSFSWMLGQEPQASSARGTFLASSPFSDRRSNVKRLSRGHSAYLFGEDGNVGEPEVVDKVSVSPSGSSTIRPRKDDFPLSRLQGKE